MTSAHAAAAAGGAGDAQESNAVTEVVIVGTTPLVGTGIDMDKLPGNIQSVTAADVARSGTASIITAVDGRLGSVNINDNLDDPFQPDILFRGFEASPVLGTPQGLAVYQDGVRINEAFGDTLNWDLITDIAVDRIDVFGANPVYGLNALGGAVAVTMKDGFRYQGASAEVSGGSWSQRQGAFQYGANNDTWGVYMGGRLQESDGWRAFSRGSVRQLYGAVSYRSGELRAGLSYSGADNDLAGESPTPVQELAIHRSLVFTSPQQNANRLNFLTLAGSYAVNERWSVQGNAYYRNFRQGVVNGNTTEYTACSTAANAGNLCQADGTTPLGNAAGGLLPDISNGGSTYLGENDREAIRTAAGGGSLQLTATAALWGHENHLSVGVSIDSDDTTFGSSVEVGTINGSLQIATSGLFVDTPEHTPWTATPVGLRAANRYYAIFGSDTFNVTRSVALTVSGRYNRARVDLHDQLGTALSGNNSYSKFNPALGLTDKLNPGLTVYAGYSQGNRVPTAGEIECSDPTAPCLLPSSLSSDPPVLRQPISHTWELGLRGSFDVVGASKGRISWNAGLFRTDVNDDIHAVATSLSAGYFQNIGGTRREGAELGLRYRGQRLNAYANYSYVAATFRSALLLPSSSNSAADANGDIQVTVGDFLPGIPLHRLKTGIDLRVVPAWVIGADLSYESSQYFRGDESNQMAALPGFLVANLHTSWQPTRHVEVFARLVNLFNRRYATVGVLGDPTGIGAPGIAVAADTNDPGVDNRFESPAAPLSALVGVRILL